MDTKLKNISYNKWLKTIAFLVGVICFAVAFSFICSIIDSSRGANQLFVKDYLSTPAFESRIQTLYSCVERLFTLKNEEYINELAANHYNDQIQDGIARLETANDYLNREEGFYYYISDGKNVFTNCNMTTAAEFKRYNSYNITDRNSMESTISFYVDYYIPTGSNTKVYIAVEPELYVQEKVDVMYSHLYTLYSLKSQQHINDVAVKKRDEQVQNDLQEFASVQNILNNLEGIYYYATDGDSVYTNCDMTTADQFKTFGNYNIIDGYATENKIGNNANWSMQLAPNKKVFVSVDADFIAEEQARFEGTKVVLQREMRISAVLIFVSLLMLVYLIFVCGRNTAGQPADKNIGVHAIDKLWTELTLGTLILVMCGFVAIAVELFGNTPSVYVEFQSMAMAASAVACSLCLTLLLSLVRHIKNRTLIKHSFIYIVCRKTIHTIKKIFDAILIITPLNTKVIGAIIFAELVAIILTSMFAWSNGEAVLQYFILIIAATTGIIYFVVRYAIKPYDDQLKTELEQSLSRELKAERLKTELITNISHDLKTPLTAIINYSDLLVKQDGDDKYAKIIYEKSQKLKTLTEDLFEVSKAQSGNISVTLESLDVSELINQTLAEFEQNTVIFKINVPNSLKISADSSLMNRVFENLIGNIIKYSHADTRAYIEAYESDKKTNITFKNIANYEMGFNSDEMIERFSRGETSRATDGNGLGLAIAHSYVQACGGKLNISIDGDLFKATLTFQNQS